MKSKWTQRVAYLVYYAFSTLILLEGLLWLCGFRPYRYIPFSIESNPPGAIVAHEKLGFALNPGIYQVTINEKLTYQVTHNANGSRSTPGRVNDSTMLSVAIFGCSYTYGMGEGDTTVMHMLLQRKMPEYKVNNYAVPGYGTVQNYLQLQEMVENGTKPAIAIFNFADFHLDRNSMSPSYRLHLNIGYQQAAERVSAEMQESNFPYVRFRDDSLQLMQVPWSQLYFHWWGREQLALVNLLQTINDQFETAGLEVQRNSLLLFEKIAALCHQNDIRLLVTGLTQSTTTTNFLKLLSENGIEVLDMSLPLTEPTYHHYPLDTHPNSKAHHHFAEQINSYLSQHPQTF